MPTEPVFLDVGDCSYRGRLTEPEEPTDSGVLVLPGLNHGPFGDVFDQFAQAAAAEGHRVVRFETWADEETLVAKSFGGRLALTHLPREDVDRMVLWAPAVFVGDHDDERPTIDPEELTAIDCPVRLLQGDEDRGMSVENASAIVEKTLHFLAD